MKRPKGKHASDFLGHDIQVGQDVENEEGASMNNYPPLLREAEEGNYSDNRDHTSMRILEELRFLTRKLQEEDEAKI